MRGRTHDADPARVLEQALSLLDVLPLDVVLYDDSLAVVHARTHLIRGAAPLQNLDSFLTTSTEPGTHPREGWRSWLTRAFGPSPLPPQDGVLFLQDGRPRWVRVQARALRDVPGLSRPLVLLTIEDMGQLMRTRQRLDHHERLAALGKITSKVAHELNSPLDGVLRYLNLAERAVGEGNVPKSREYLERCREGLRRMVHIVAELLEHARTPRRDPTWAPLRTTLEDALHAAGGKSPRQTPPVSVDIRLDPDIPELPASQLYQVLCNVLRNAYEAMPDGGRLSIVAERSRDKHIDIRVHDTGVGIAASDLPQVFAPFFTTKATGTGLGLAVSREIVTGYGGHMEIDSRPGEGTTVSIQLALDRIR